MVLPEYTSKLIYSGGMERSTRRGDVSTPPFAWLRAPGGALKFSKRLLRGGHRVGGRLLRRGLGAGLLDLAHLLGRQLHRLGVEGHLVEAQADVDHLLDEGDALERQELALLDLAEDEEDGHLGEGGRPHAAARDVAVVAAEVPVGEGRLAARAALEAEPLHLDVVGQLELREDLDELDRVRRQHVAVRRGGLRGRHGPELLPDGLELLGRVGLGHTHLHERLDDVLERVDRVGRRFLVDEPSSDEPDHVEEWVVEPLEREHANLLRFRILQWRFFPQHHCAVIG